MIVTGAWWDTVDVIAPKLVGGLLRRHPKELRKVLLSWSKGDDLWKRRSAILAQLDFKRDTDMDFLCACIEPSLSSREFFLRKAIGWSLRQYARVDPKAVVRYVRAKKDELSPLAKREALKALLKSGAVASVP
jgi:3-methyladenine DNA glycosylase AlkD